MSIPAELKILLDNIDMELLLDRAQPEAFEANARYLRKWFQRYGFKVLCDVGSYRLVFSHETYPGMVFKVARQNQAYHNQTEYDTWSAADETQRGFLARHLFLSRNGLISVMEEVPYLWSDKYNFPFTEEQVSQFKMCAKNAWPDFLHRSAMICTTITLVLLRTAF